jgi:hypothetical protein
MYSFRKFLLEQTFGEFQQWLQQNHLDIGTLIKQLQQKSPDGHGGNGVFYKIPGTNYGVKIMRGGWADKVTEPSKLTAAHDPFGDENFGQPIANFGPNVQVLKLQSGVPAGHPYKVGKTPEAKEAAKQKYLENLQVAAEMPLEEYVRLFKSILKINSQGYVLDPSKSGNMLVDKNNKRFNLVDINKSESDYRNNASEVMTMLIDNYNFGKYFTNDPQVKNLAKQIIEKCEKAAEITGLPINKTSSSAQYSYSHAYDPPKEPWKPEPQQPANGWGQLDVW